MAPLDRKADADDNLATMRAPIRAAVATLALVAAATTARADGGSPTAVVGRAGARVVTAGELEDRIAHIPPFQLKGLGGSIAEIRRNLLDRALLRDALFAQGAKDQGLDKQPEVRERLDRVMRNALLDQLRKEVLVNSPVSDEEVKAYYDANPEKFHAPPRIAIWRILVPTREKALEVLGAAQKDLTLKTWNQLAREQSVDKATNMRGGNLGFVAPDGKTAEANVNVSPVLFAAASKVEDGALVTEPVKEGAAWAVVWRRQSMREITRTMEQEAPSIRQVVAHTKTEKRVRELVEGLRKERLTELNEDLVDQIEIGPMGEVQPIRRPGALPTSRARTAAPPQPRETPGGLR